MPDNPALYLGFATLYIITHALRSAARNQEQSTMQTYFVEITDTFGGEANYSWVTRHKVRASSPRGAMIRVNRDSGLGFRRTADYGDSLRYDSRSGATCAFVSEWDDAEHGELSRVNKL